MFSTHQMLSRNAVTVAGSKYSYDIEKNKDEVNVVLSDETGAVAAKGVCEKTPDIWEVPNSLNTPVIKSINERLERESKEVEIQNKEKCSLWVSFAHSESVANRPIVEGKKFHKVRVHIKNNKGIIVPSFYQLKPLFQQSLSGIVRRLASVGATANQITLLAVALSIALGMALACFPKTHALWLLLPAFLFVRMALNAIDGMLARQYHQQSALGGLLNEAGDVVSDAVLYLPFALLDGVHAGLVVAVVLLAWLTEFIGVCAVMVGTSRRYDGPMGKSDRAFVFGACGLALGVGWSAEPWINVMLMIIALMSLITTLNRARAALKEIQ